MLTLMLAIKPKPAQTPASGVNLMIESSKMLDSWLGTNTFVSLFSYSDVASITTGKSSSIFVCYRLAAGFSLPTR